MRRNAVNLLSSSFCLAATVLLVAQSANGGVTYTSIRHVVSNEYASPTKATLNNNATVTWDEDDANMIGGGGVSVHQWWQWPGGAGMYTNPRSLNDNGNTVFYQSIDGGAQAIQFGGVDPIVAVPGTPLPTGTLYIVTEINNANLIAAALGGVDSGGAPKYVYTITAAGTGKTTIATEGDVIDGNTLQSSFWSPFNNGLHINNAGDVMFLAHLNAQPGDTFDEIDRGMYFHDGTSIRTVIDTTAGVGAAFDLLIRSAFNDSGKIVFTADRPDGHEGVYTINSDGTGLTMLVDTVGAYASFGEVSINNGGRVAFQADLDDDPADSDLNGQRGLFDGPDPLTNRIIMEGDQLFGRDVTIVDVYQHFLNDNDQVVFVAQTGPGGGSGQFHYDVVVATVPEPAMVGLLAVGALALLRRRRR